MEKRKEENQEGSGQQNQFTLGNMALVEVIFMRLFDFYLIYAISFLFSTL